MRKQDQLIALISSLTQGERKFFVQNSKSSSGPKSYLKLYELLLKEESYQPEELCEKLNKSKAGLANEKKYLEHNLLAALRQYHADNSSVSVLNHFADSVLLMERNMPAMAERSVKQSIESATRLGLPTFTFHGHGLMLTLCSDPFVSAKEVEQKANTHLLEMKAAANLIQLTVDFELFSNEVYAAYDKRKKDITDSQRKETQRLLNNKLLKDSYGNSDFMFYKFNLLALLYSRIGNNAANIEVNRKCLELYETQPTIDVYGYFNAVANLTQSIIASCNKQMYLKWMAKLDSKYYHKLPIDYKHLDRLLNSKKSVFTSGFYYAQLLKNDIATEPVRQYAKKFIKEFAKEKSGLTSSHFLGTVYRTATCCFMIGEYSDAITLLNHLFNDDKESETNVSYKYAKLLFVFLHIELNNLSLLPSLIQNTISYMKRTFDSASVELTLLKHCLLYVKLSTPKEKRLWRLSLQKKCNEWNALEEGKRLLSVLPIEFWLSK
ncbi:MAG: hypothetical protein U0T32_12235 [Chitinophagales bacterium]